MNARFNQLEIKSLKLKSTIPVRGTACCGFSTNGHTGYVSRQDCIKYHSDSEINSDSHIGIDLGRRTLAKTIGLIR